MKRKMDAYINAVRYEKKLATRNLKEIEERLDETAKHYPEVDLASFYLTRCYYQGMIHTFDIAIRLYRKHKKVEIIPPYIPMSPAIPAAWIKEDK